MSLTALAGSGAGPLPALGPALPSLSEHVHQRNMICLRDRMVADACKRLPSLKEHSDYGLCAELKTRADHKQWTSAMEVFRPVGEQWSPGFCQFPVRRRLSGNVLSEILLLQHRHDLSSKNVLLQSLSQPSQVLLLTLHGHPEFRFHVFINSIANSCPWSHLL